MFFNEGHHLLSFVKYWNSDNTSSKIFFIIRDTTLIPPFFPIWGYILEHWLPIHDLKYGAAVVLHNFSHRIYLRIFW